jgi:hypothetical protein
MGFCFEPAKIETFWKSKTIEARRHEGFFSVWSSVLTVSQAFPLKSDRRFLVL